MGLGITGAQRLTDVFKIDSEPGKGTTVCMAKALPPSAPPVTAAVISKIGAELAKATPDNALSEVLRQNQELIHALEALRARQTEIERLNRELEDTNRGVVGLYTELDEKAGYLQRAAELKTSFLSNMSHEFRTPLNAILSLSQLLLERIDGELTSEQAKQVSYIRKGAMDLSELVNDLLDLARVEAGKVMIRPTEFSVGELFGALRGMLRPLLAHNSSVSLVFDDAEGLAPFITDEGKVSQILRNLISNALKFTEQGEVRVSAQQSTDSHVLFSVADTGIGIAIQDRERIFEEFVQVEGPIQRRVKGTGLGLPLSRKLTELLGGMMWVESEPGKGSTFYVQLPATYVGPHEVSVAPDLARKVDPNRSPILVVEDNAETLLLYDKYFKGTEFQPIPAKTIREAREA
ncbi:MAG: ATP-binding protein, partial [Actinomycetota bacterium]